MTVRARSENEQQMKNQPSFPELGFWFPIAQVLSLATPTELNTILAWRRETYVYNY